MERLSLSLDKERLSFEGSRKINSLASLWEDAPEDFHLLWSIEKGVEILRMLTPEMDLQHAQNVFFTIAKREYPQMKKAEPPAGGGGSGGGGGGPDEEGGDHQRAGGGMGGAFRPPGPAVGIGDTVGKEKTRTNTDCHGRPRTSLSVPVRACPCSSVLAKFGVQLFL